MKKKIIIITLILIISISIVKLYQTYAISSSVTGDNDNYTVNLNGNTSVVVPANGNKTVYYKIRNTNNGTVKYGIGYKSINAVVKVYFDSESSSTGLINKEENKFIKLYLENSSSSSETVYLTTVLGYENGGNLIVPDGYYLVTNFYSKSEGAAQKIVKLYEQASKTNVINNDITYQYDTNHNLMKDVGGNIRYYGEKPNNYIYFNCSDYASQTSSTCEKWRIVGVFNGKVKIMRDMPIGKYSWDNKGTTSGAETSDGKNEWPEARLMKMLNPNYDSELGGSLYWNRKNGTCYSGKTADNTKECDMSSIGLKNDTTKSAIADNTWYIRSYNNGELYPNQIYRNEVVDGTIFNETRSTTWNGKIGLISVSDYLFASDFKICNESVNQYSKNYSCSKNWIKDSFTNVGSGVSGWFITPGSFNSSSVKYLITGTNALSSIFANLEWYVSPTLFLNKDIDISTGNGTSDNPYQLKIENNQQYTITYNANGGSGAPSNQTKKHGENITLSSVKPTKTGYTFTGWNTSSNGSGTSYSSGGTYSNNSNVTLYAQWQSVSSYTVTVYLQGELINNYTVVPGNDLSTRFGVDSEEPFRYGNCTNGASITGSVSRVNNMSVATINVTNITSDTVCNLYYTLI